MRFHTYVMLASLVLASLAFSIEAAAVRPKPPSPSSIMSLQQEHGGGDEESQESVSSDVAFAAADAVALVMIGGLLGAAYDYYVLRVCGWKVHEARIPRWIIGVYIPCYCLLIPGIFTTVLNLDVEVYEQSLSLTSAQSMWSIVASTGSVFGRILVALYSVVLPQVKLLLAIAILACSEMSAGSTGISTVQHRCSWLLKVVCKWETPKVFWYVGVVMLFSALNDPPDVVANVSLNHGFAYLSVYCIGTLLGALGLPHAAREEGLPADDPHGPPLQALYAGHIDIVLVVSYLFCSFLCLLAAGVSLVLAFVSTTSPGQTVPSYEASFSLATGITDAMRAIFGAHGTSAFVLAAMLIFFVMVFPVAHMILLGVTAVHLRRGIDSPAAANAHLERGLKACQRANSLGYLSLLDTFLVGFVVSGFSCSSLGSKVGADMSCGMGLSLLVVADIFHWIAHSVTNAATSHAASRRGVGPDKDSKDKQLITSVDTAAPVA